jgi:hypothetical protein
VPGLALVVVLSGACGPLVDRAPFPGRSDSLTPGDLLGPFDGVVTDAETDRPIAGAVVAASWAFERGVGLVGPSGARDLVTETGVDGRYRIPGLRDLPSGRSTKVRRFTLIVYKNGYVAWRSDRLFPGGEARHDFSQRDNRARLEKWRPALQHHRHLVFMGGGSAIKTAASWEVAAAVLELDGSTPAAREAAAKDESKPVVAALDVAGLLSEDELRAVTGYAGQFELLKLTDLPTTEFYDSRHFKAQGKPEAYDVGYRVWRLGTAGAEAQYAKLLAELPGAVAANEIGDQSLRAQTGDIMGLAFLARDKGIVVSVTCGLSQCTEASMILRLAKLVESRLGELPGRESPGLGTETPE